MLYNDYELFYFTICVVVAKHMRHMGALSFTSNFLTQFRFSVEMFWFKWNFLMNRDILLLQKPRTLAISAKLKSVFLAFVIMSLSKALKYLTIFPSRGKIQSSLVILTKGKIFIIKFSSLHQRTSCTNESTFQWGVVIIFWPLSV